MIKINLIQKGAKQRNAMLATILELVLFVAVLAVAGAVVIIWNGMLSSDIKDLQAKVQREKQEQARLKKIIDKVETLKKKREIFERKISIISELKRKQTGPEKMMKFIAAALPDLFQVTDVVERSGMLNIKGVTFSSFAVSKFIKELKKTGMFEDIDPKNLKLKEGGRAEMYEFEITSRIIYTDDDAEAGDVANP